MFRRKITEEIENPIHQNQQKLYLSTFKKLENPQDFIINCPYGLKDEDMFDNSKLALLVRKIRSLKKLNPVDLLFIESLDVDDLVNLIYEFNLAICLNSYRFCMRIESYYILLKELNYYLQSLVE